MEKILNILTVILTVVVIGLGLVVFFVFFPWFRAANGMPKDTNLILVQQEDDTLRLHWPESTNADTYLIEVYYLNDDMTPEERPVFSSLCSDNSCVLPAELPEDRLLYLRVGTQRSFHILGNEYVRKGTNTVAVSCYLNRPQIFDLHWQADARQDTVALSWQGWEGDSFRLYRILPDGERELIKSLEQVYAEIHFGEQEELPLPEWEQDYVFLLRAVRELPKMTFIGKNTLTFTVTRGDLLSDRLAVRCSDTGDNSYVLTWDETKGTRYQVQVLNAGGGWETLREYTQADARVYDTGRLRAHTDYTFRVIATEGDGASDSQIVAGSEQIEVHTSVSSLYATIWPTKDLNAYTDTDRRETVGTVRAGSAYCILEEKNDMFRVQFAVGEEGWIDSSYCMINLPDYIGNLCSYDITNSYSSIYLVHDYPISLVSGTVISGYENILLEDGSFVVPLLYPVAKKLLPAAIAANLDGYRLKIYDSFRPTCATRSIYDLTAAILDDRVPEQTWQRVTLQEYLDGTNKNAFWTTLAQDEADQESDRPTYRQVMSNGGYNLGSFLASVGSMHNLGIAMDLMLEQIDTGEEMSAQTNMHDLSWYSAMSLNTENANLLDKYMKSAGFGSIGSEWWHYQDNDAKSSLNPPSLWNGVSVEGWKADDTGWRYRYADGSFCEDMTLVIEGAEYRFDANGYLK